MTDFFWPGDDRAGDHFTGGQLLAAMLAVEESWLGVLVDGGVAPETARSHLLVRHEHVEWIEDQAELAGNPVPALLDLLREDPDLGPETQRWLHRGLTSQDVLDTALVWCLGGVVEEVAADLRRQVATLADLAETHRRTPTVARTLTQHAVPTTFGLKVATWLTAVLDAYDDLSGLTLPVQVGGAAGTMAAAVELGLDPAVARARVADDLGLTDAPRVAHGAQQRHPCGRRPGALHRRLGPDRQRRADPLAARGRRGLRGRRRRVVHDAPQGQPGAVGPGAAGRADHPDAGRHPARGRGRPGRRARRRRLARRVGAAARPGAPDRWSPAPRRPTCSRVSRSTRTGWPPPRRPPATACSRSSG